MASKGFDSDALRFTLQYASSSEKAPAKSKVCRAVSYNSAQSVATVKPPSPVKEKWGENKNAKFLKKLSPGDYIWLPDDIHVVVPAKVIRMGTDTFTVETEDDQEHEIPTLELFDLESFQNGTANARVEDLAALQISGSFDYPILHAIRERYKKNNIYTNFGDILIAINPYQLVQGSYTPDIMEQYQAKHTVGKPAAPHIYDVAHRIYSCMMDSRQDQSVVMYGHQGGGKSESSKIFIQYVCDIKKHSLTRRMCEKAKDLRETVTIEQQLLHSNTILEAFGNARTERNRNSSRFAKLVSIDFNKEGSILGGAVVAQFVEKSRVTAADQNNFHVFYWLMAAARADVALNEALKLNKIEIPNDDEYETGKSVRIKGYRDLNMSLSALRFSQSSRMNIFRVLAAILHLLTVTFKPESERNGPCLVQNADNAASLLQVPVESLQNYFRTRKSREGEVRFSANSAQSSRTRDLLCQTLYVQLFSWIIEEINITLGHQFERYENSDIVVETRGIHILDMFGFDPSCEKNGLETLCINYWNEKMRLLFLSNQREAEEIPADVIGGQDAIHQEIMTNSCVSLFESNPEGIFPMLDAQTRARSRNDAAYVIQIVQNASSYISASAVCSTKFIINHFGRIEPTEYEGAGFIRQNGEINTSTTSNLLQSSTNELVTMLGLDEALIQSTRTSEARSSSKLSHIQRKKGKTLCARFHYQMVAVSEALKTTHLHFIMCICPNATKESNSFDSMYVLNQLKQFKIPLIAQQQQVGFPSHLTHVQFYRRYKDLTANDGKLDRLLQCLTEIGALADGEWYNGETHVHLRRKQYQRLESFRRALLSQCAGKIQRNMKHYISNSSYERSTKKIRDLGRFQASGQAEDYLIKLSLNCTECLRFFLDEKIGNQEILTEQIEKIQSLQREVISGTNLALIQSLLNETAPQNMEVHRLADVVMTRLTRQKEAEDAFENATRVDTIANCLMKKLEAGLDLSRQDIAQYSQPQSDCLTAFLKAFELDIPESLAALLELSERLNMNPEIYPEIQQAKSMSSLIVEQSDSRKSAVAQVEIACLARDQGMIEEALGNAKAAGIAEWDKNCTGAKKVLRKLTSEKKDPWESYFNNEYDQVDPDDSFCIEICRMKQDRLKEVEETETSLSTTIDVDFNDLSRLILEKSLEIGVSSSNVAVLCEKCYQFESKQNFQKRLEEILQRFEKTTTLSSNVIKFIEFQMKFVSNESELYQRSQALLQVSETETDCALAWSPEVRECSIVENVLNSMSRTISRCILGYMRDRVSVYPTMLVQLILQLGLKQPAVADEIYLQLICQLINNPSVYSQLDGWTLLSICVSSFPPSETYLEEFLHESTSNMSRKIQQYAKYSLNRLVKEPVELVPTLAEISAFELRPPLLATICLIDGTVLASDLPITPELTVAQVVEICSENLGLEEKLFGFFGLFLQGSGKCLRQDDYLSNYDDTEIFVFKLRLILNKVSKDNRLCDPMDQNDEIFTHLLYLQSLDEVVSGRLRIRQPETISRLAAIAIAVDNDAEDEFLTDSQAMMEYIPNYPGNLLSEEEWAREILSRRQEVRDKSTVELQHLFLSEIHKYRLYGSIFFPVTLLNRSHSVVDGLPQEMVFALNGDGIHILDTDGQTLRSYSYGDFHQSGVTSHTFWISIFNFESKREERITVRTREPSEMIALVQDFVRILVIHA